MKRWLFPGLVASSLLALPGLAQAAVLAAPASLTVAPGETSAPVTVTLTFTGLAAAPGGLQILAVQKLPPGVTTQPSPVTYVAGGAATATTVFRFVVGAAVPFGSYPIALSDTSAGAAGSTSFLLVVAPRIPTVAAIVPATVSAGTNGMRLRLIGRGFSPQVPFAFSGQGVSVTATRVVSPSLAEVVVSVADTASPGPRSLQVVTPNGNATVEGASLVVLPALSPAGAVSVATIAILTPLSGAFVGTGEDVRPHGLIAAAGAGSIVGSWRIDGVPFDRFTLQARGGLPLPVTSRVPLPPLARGRHRLELAVESPQQLVSEPVFLTTVGRRASALRILAPRDGAALSAVPPLTRLSWSPVPGVSGYRVAFRDGSKLVTSFRLSATELVVDQEVLRRIGVGSREWSVVPVFPGEVEGEPCPARRLAVPPAQLTISGVRVEREARTHAIQVRWDGEAAGVVFRIEIWAPGHASAAFTALTRTAPYRLPAAAHWSAGHHRVRVVALGPAGEQLGEAEATPAQSDALPEPASQLVPASETSEATVTSIAPADGETVPITKPPIDVSWTGPSPQASERFLSLDGTDVTTVATWSDGSLHLDPPVPLGEGSHEVVLRFGEAELKWSFTVQAAAAGSGPLGAPATASNDQVEWNAAAEATAARTRRSKPDGATENPLQPGDDTIGLHLSGLLGLENDASSVKASGDLGVRHDFHQPPDSTDPWLAQENRSWLGQVGVGKPGLKLDADVGYDSPGFLDQAQILTAGVSRGGMQGKLQASWLTGWFYRSFDAPTDGIASGLPVQQNVWAAAIELSRNPATSFLRAVQFVVQDPDSAPEPRRRGTLRGVLAHWSLPQIDFTVEGAHSNIQNLDATLPGDEQSGNAFRGGLSGHTSTVHYSLSFNDTGRGFSNPANGGFTGSATPGFGADADFGYSFAKGAASLSLAAHHLQSPVVDAADAPNVRQESGDASLGYGLGHPASIQVAANLVLRRGDAYAALSLPETDARDLGTTVTLSQTVKAFTFSEVGSVQASRNLVDPTSDQTVWNANLSFNGNVRSILTLSATAGWNRVAADPALGDTDSLQLSLQPSLTLVQGSLTIQPAILYSKSSNTTLMSDTRSEEYAAAAGWTPLALKSMLAIQVQLDWSRSVVAGVDAGSFSRTATANLTLSWGSSGSRPVGVASQPVNPGARQAWLSPVRRLPGRPSWPRATSGPGLGGP